MGIVHQPEERGRGPSFRMAVKCLIQFAGMTFDPGQNQAGGEFTGRPPAHSIGERENEVGRLKERFSMVIKPPGPVRTDFESEVGIVIGRPHHAPFRQR